MFKHYKTGGPLACRRAGLKRSQPSMVSRARVLGVRANRAAITARRENAEPAWCLPRHDLLESLDNVRLRKWRGPVSPGPLRWAA
jgi:hypothetical protein